MDDQSYILLSSPFDFVKYITNFFDWVASLYTPIFHAGAGLIGIAIAVSIPLSLAFLIGIIYCVESLKIVRKKEGDIYDKKVEPAIESASGDAAMAKRWQNALNRIESENTSDWKQSIMEADIILDDLLSKMGYRGDGVGEKLKRVQPGEMKTLDDAWEAHKVRNSIAHDPNFTLNQHEAKRILHLFRKVFEEFYYI